MSHVAPVVGSVAGISVAELARDFGTPLFVYDAETIRARAASLRAFDVVRYAQKANANLAILDLLRREGVLVDAVSAGEIHRALTAGFPATGEPPPIVYTADLFDAESLDLVVEHGIAVNCGSPDMIEQYAERVSGGSITLRINPGFGHGHSRKTNTGGPASKHGVWHEDLARCVALARERGLEVDGVHVHIGSGSDFAHLSRVCEALAGFARTVGPSVQVISAGGGLPVPSGPEEPGFDTAAYYGLWDDTRRALEKDFGHPVRLETEPGRYLVAESGWLVAEVRAVKQQGENRFVLLDAGFNNLARPILYGARHPMALAPSGGGDAREPVDVVVGGPLCESGDIFTQDEGGFVRSERLPAPRVGDFLVIGQAGAYAFAMSSNYNSKRLAAEVLVTEGKAHLVRARQTLDDLIRGEIVPPRG